MFDEMNECNASTFAVFWEYKNPHKFFHQFSFGATIMNQAFYKLSGFSYFKNMANFEALHSIHYMEYKLFISEVWPSSWLSIL